MSLTSTITEPPRHVLELPGGVTMAFRLIPAGSFRMGSRGYEPEEEPIHQVTIAQPFWLAETPVTQRQYLAVAPLVEALKERCDPSEFKGQERPVENVDWLEANHFCDWLTQNLLSIESRFGPMVRCCLPTEAEWEYACRAGTDTEYYSGDGAGALTAVGWFRGNSGNETHLVDSKQEQHPWGLQSMHGNVWEWCHDRYESLPYRGRMGGETDPDGLQRMEDWKGGIEELIKITKPGARRVVRGGSCWDDARDCRSACRDSPAPGRRNGSLGFRLAAVSAIPGRAQEQEIQRRPEVDRESEPRRLSRDWTGSPA